MSNPHPARSAADEESRLEVLRNLEILDSPPDDALDAIVQAARRVVCCETALISLVDRNRQWFKAKSGLIASETPREHAFCAHAIMSDEALIVADATLDPRFNDNPLVTGTPHIQFYAGIPLRVTAVSDPSASAIIGTLCVIDSRPRVLSETQLGELKALAHVAEALIEARSNAARATALANERSKYLHESDLHNRQFRQAERIANIGSWRLDLASDETQWSEQVYVIHGLAPGSDRTRVEALDFYPSEARSVIAAALESTIATGESFDVETDFKTAQGEYRRVRSMGELEVNNGVGIAVVGVFQDITRQYRLEQQLRRSAHSDALTGLPNRASFNEFLDDRLGALAGSDRPLALFLIDLDDFKLVNDRCGHRSGDEHLQQTARALRTFQSAETFVARLGGDEFVMVIENSEHCKALARFATRVLASLNHSISSQDGIIMVSATIGASLMLGDTQSRTDLLDRADRALYEAKRSGRNCARQDGKAPLLARGPDFNRRGIRIVA